MYLHRNITSRYELSNAITFVYDMNYLNKTGWMQNSNIWRKISYLIMEHWARNENNNRVIRYNPDTTGGRCCACYKIVIFNGIEINEM